MYDYKKTYNKAYKENENYNFVSDCKIKDFINWIDGKKGSIVDIGAGSGQYSKILKQKKFNVLAVEVSNFACQKYLKKINHINKDMLSFLEETEDKFDWLLCTDVLEHLEEEYAFKCLPLMAKVAGTCLIGIANHPDVVNGVQLHLIQEDDQWWRMQLEKHFKVVKRFEDTCCVPKMFFMFECSGEIDA